MILSKNFLKNAANCGKLKKFVNSNFLKQIKIRIADFNIFRLGESTIFYHLVIFYLVPFVSLFNPPIKFIFVNYKIPWEALGYVAMGILMFATGYFIPFGKNFAKKIPNFLAGAWNLKRAKIAFWAIFFIGAVSKIIRYFGGGYFIKTYLNLLFGQNVFYSLFGYLDWFYYIALVIALINYYQLKKAGDKNYQTWKLLAFGSLSIEIIYWLASCSRLAIITPILLYLLVRSFLYKFNYKQIILVGIGIVLVLFPFGNICRHPMILNAYQIFKIPVNENENNDWLVNLRNIDIVNAGGFAVNSFLYRMNQSLIFSKILDAPPALIASYSSSFSNFLATLGPPRFLWKNKPLSLNVLGNEFGRRIEVLASDDFVTSIGPAYIGDFYIKFGIWGVILGMFLMGVFFRFIYVFLMEPAIASPSGLMVYGIFWIQIMKGSEDWIAPVWAGLVKFFVILFVIHLFIKERAPKTNG